MIITQLHLKYFVVYFLLQSLYRSLSNYTTLYVVSYAYEAQAISQLVRRLSILQSHSMHLLYHHVISLQLC